MRRLRSAARRLPLGPILAFGLLLVLLLPGVARADQHGVRTALIIGNAAYASVSPLENPRNDANDVAAALDSLGFQVFLGLDQGREDMLDLVARFVAASANADAALFYFAGHGFQIGARNFLVPVDADLARPELFLQQVIPMDDLLGALEAVPGVKLIFLDACRDNPLGAAAGSDGLARVGSAADFLFAFATQPDNVAYDGIGRNSFFTEALLSRIHTPGQDISELMIGVRKDVLSATGGQQIPWENSSLTRQFRFAPGQETVSPETLLWQVAASTQDPVMMSVYLDRFPEGPHVADVNAFFASTFTDTSEGRILSRQLPGADDIDAGTAAEDRLWSLAQRTRIRPLAERYLQLYPDGRHAPEVLRLLDALPLAAQTAPARTCESLATHPRDATANLAGTPFEALARNAATAIKACTAAMRAHPDLPHYRALLARATAASGDRDAAIALYRAAAEAGDLRAMVSLGLILETGDGVAQDAAAAIALYERAAAGGSPDAAINLAVALFEGRAVPRDVARAAALLEQASDAGSGIASYNLGALVDQGVATPALPALAYFQKAAREGEPRGWRAAAVLLDEGRGTPRDPDRAAEMLLRGLAADQGETLRSLTEESAAGAWRQDTLVALQRRLADAGHYDGAIDGIPGPAFEAALQSWRRGGFIGEAG